MAILGDDVAVVGDGSSGVGGIVGRAGVEETGIEVIQAAVFLAESSIQVVADAGRHAQIGPQLVLVLQIEAGLVGAIVSVAVALKEGAGQEVVVGGDQALNELAEVRRGGGAR